MTVLETRRLVLRPPRESDIAALVPLVGDFEVAKNLSRVPHPYTEEDARSFIAKTARDWATGEDMTFAVLLRDGTFLGLAGLHPQQGWEFGYWLGKPYWGHGYATEAAGRVAEFAFEALNVPALKAEWFHDNPASGHVLEKLGARPAGETMSTCLARGHKVPAHIVALDRATYQTRKMAP